MAKIMISLPDGFLRRVDRTAKAEGSWKDALAPLRQLEEQWVGRWDSTDIIRYYRERIS